MLQIDKLKSDTWQSHVRQAEDLVRESGYNYAINLQLKLESQKLRSVCSEEIISRSSSLYEQAKAMLKLLDPEGAEEFIQNSYNPNK